MRLKGKVAVVTGAAQGIGREIARLFAREGARLVLGDVQGDKVGDVARQLGEEGGEAVSVQVDVGLEAQVQSMIERAGERYGRLDVLVNNAGIGLSAPVDQVRMEDYDRVMNTNLRGVLLGCREAASPMKEVGGGSIVNIASVHGVAGWPQQSVYAATKAGIIGTTRAMAADLAPSLIRVNAISPGAIYLEQFGDWATRDVPEADREEFGRTFGEKVRSGHLYGQPLERVGEPRDIAYCALYLASDEARFVTGQNIVVDGGLTSVMSWEQPASRQQKMDGAHAEMRAWIEARKEKKNG